MSFLDLLENVPASDFTLVVQPELIQLLGSLYPYSKLTAHGVSKLTPLPEEAHVIDDKAIVFVIKPDLDSILKVGSFAKLNSKAQLCAIVYPELPPSVELVLADMGVLGGMDVICWPLICSRDPILPQIHLNFGPPHSNAAEGCWSMVASLNQLQAAKGTFSKVTAIGPQSNQVFELLKLKQLERQVELQQTEETYFRSKSAFEYEFGYSSNKLHGEEFEHLIVIDRDLDLVTPLMFEATYAGVLNEHVGVSSSGLCGNVDLKDDDFFSEVAQLSFAEACNRIHESAKSLQQEYQTNKSRQETQSASVSDMRELVNKLGSLQKTQKIVNSHAELAGAAMDQLKDPVHTLALRIQAGIMDNTPIGEIVFDIQDLIYQSAPLSIVLRLLCLVCIVRNGLKETLLNQLVFDDVLKTYGYENLHLLKQLMVRGLLFTSKGSSFFPFFKAGSIGSGSVETANKGASTPKPQEYSFSNLQRLYKLQDTTPESVAYTGHVPLMARLVENVLTSSTTKLPLDSEVRSESFVSEDIMAAKEAKLLRTLKKNSKPPHKPAILVAVLGGLTYSEIASLTQIMKNLNEKTSNVPRSIEFLVPRVITGDSLVEST